MEITYSIFLSTITIVKVNRFTLFIHEAIVNLTLSITIYQGARLQAFIYRT